MTDRARELRAALDWLENPRHEDILTLRPEFGIAIDAARLIALPILEGDARLRNAIAKIVMAEFGFVVLSKRYHIADQVLAALIPADKKPLPKITDYDYETEGLGGT